VVNNKPNVEGRCDSCNAELIIRDDDAEDTVKDRLKVYHLQTEPLTEYYKKQGILRAVHVAGEMKDVAAEIAKTLED
jgi:adenylate kinase